MSDLYERFVEFSHPFVKATNKVFESMVNTKLTTSKPTLKNDHKSFGDVSAVIGLTGQVERDGTTREFQGQMVISFPMATYLKVAGSMLMEEFTEFNDEISDVGAEICNMITGNAKRDLAQIGYKLEMAVPTTISGAGHGIKYPPKVHIVSLPFKGDIGDFVLELCYQD